MRTHEFVTKVVLCLLMSWIVGELVECRARINGFDIRKAIRNCTDCRRILRKDLQQLRRLQLIRMRIETALRVGNREPQSDGVAAPAVIHATPEPQKEKGEEEEIISFSHTVGKKKDSSILEFVINTGKNSKELEVISANLWVLVKKRGKHKKSKRIVLKVFEQSDKGNALLTYLKTRVKKTKWQKLSLPISLIQTLMKPPQRKLLLRLDCRRCGRSVKLVLPKERKRKKRKRDSGPSLRRLRTEKSIRKRPFLHIFTRVKRHSESKKIPG